jgi:uncharacterized protein with ParB-like and HNH nuclease domain
MMPSIKTLSDIFYSASQWVIPVFQRNYRWEKPQWEKVWTSLEEIQRPEKKGNHFMGFLVYQSSPTHPGDNIPFYLIDGQQRLTTLAVLLAAIRNVARRQGVEELADEIHQDYLVHPRRRGEGHFRVLPKERDHDSYLALVSGDGDVVGRLAGALAYFEEMLNSRPTDDLPTYLRALFNTIRQRLEFMCALLDTENAYNIFKSLNSLGVRLDDSDLIRNFVFMHVRPEEHDEFDRNLWRPLETHFAREDGTLDEENFSQFFRDFLMSSSGYISPRDTFETFEARYEATGFEPAELARSLLLAAGDYDVICGTRPDADTEVTDALARLNALESSTTYPLLLSLFGLRRNGLLDTGDLSAIIQMLSGFIFRRFICNESSRGYGRMFVRALSGIGTTPRHKIGAYFLERGWPDDRRFTAAFITFPIYQRAYTKHVLETIERSRGHREPADLSDAQIEHIMPQTLTDAWRADLGPDADRVYADWLDCPGNLTLTGYNPPLSNDPFTNKQEYYSNSNIVITRELREFDHWGEDTIKARGEKLASEAAILWVGPEPDTSLAIDL